MNYSNIVNTLREVQWREVSSVAVQVLADMRVSGSIAFFFLIIYFIGYDTVLRPNMEILKGIDESIKTQQDVIADKKKDQEKYQLWAKELEGLKAHLITLSSNDVPTVIAAGELSEIQAIMTGKSRNASTEEPLSAPHDKVENVVVKQTSMTEVTLKSEDAAAKSAENSKPASGPSMAGAKVAEAGPPREAPAVPNEVTVTRYDYEASATGTFAALVDVVNHLVMREKLIVIRDIELATATLPEGVPRPDPKTEENAPVKVDMKLKLSVYMAPEVKKAN